MTQNRTELGKVVGANLKRLIKESVYRAERTNILTERASYDEFQNYKYAKGYFYYI